MKNGNFEEFTHFKEIYGKNEMTKEEKLDYIEKEIEPCYELLRRRFFKLFGKDLKKIVRIPYVVSLIGDHVTNMFNDKVVVTTEKDCLMAARPIKDEVQIVIGDNYSEIAVYKLGENETTKEGVLEHYNWAFTGWKKCLEFADLNNEMPGAQIIINFNTSDYNNDINYKINCYIGAFLLCLSLYKDVREFNINKVYQFLEDELTKMNLDFYIPYLFAQFYLDKQEFLLYFNKKFFITKFQNDLMMFKCDSFTPEPPSYYSNSNYKNKREFEVKLGLLLILKRYKSNR